MPGGLRCVRPKVCKPRLEKLAAALLYFSGGRGGGFCDVFTLFGSRSNVAPVFISASPSRTWAALCNPSRSSPRSREPPHRVPEPKRPSPPPGRTTRWTSAWTSWVRGCSRPSPCSPPSTPSSKVRAAAELRRGLSLPHCMSFTTWHFH